MYHFYRIKFQFLTDSTDFKKPCERKAKNTFAHGIYAKFAYMQITCVQGFRYHKRLIFFIVGWR